MVSPDQCAVVDALPVPAAVVDAGGLILHGNLALHELFGYSGSELVGVTVGQLCKTPFLVDERLSPYRAGDTVSYARRGDGSEILIKVSYRPIARTNQHLWLPSHPPEQDTVGSVRKHRVAHDELRGLFEYATVAVGYIDLVTLKYSRANRKLAEFTGYSIAELSNLGPGDVTHPDDWGQHLRLLQECASGERTEYSLLKRFQKPDGEIRYAQVSGRVIQDDKGHPAYCVATAIDVTAWQTAERALRDSEKRLRLATDAGDVGIWSLDLRSHRVEWSEAVCRHLGLPIGTKPSLRVVLNCVHADDMDVVRAIMLAAGASRTQFRCEFRSCPPDGSAPRWVTLIGRPERSPESGLVKVIGVTIDCTESRENQEYAFRLNQILEARVKERTEELEAAVAELESLSYSISHDLRAPLRAIISTSSFLLDEFGAELPDEVQFELKRQAKAGRRLSSLIDGLLEFGRLGRRELYREPVNLTQIAHEIMDEVSRVYPSGSVEFDIADDLIAEGDSAMLRRLLQNLIENAVKFSQPHSRVELGRIGDAFYVRDNGIGFEPQYKQRIFRPFERLHRDEDYPGTGIGLANVKRIVERHEGSVWVESELGSGATFFFTLG